MKRWVRRLPVVLIGILAATATTTITETATAPAGAAVIARASASAAPTASSGDLEARLVGDDSILVDPGTSLRRSFVVTNHSTSLRLTVRLSTVDASVRSDGEVRYANDASPTGPASWLTLSDVIATLEPGASVHGSFTIAPPADADPGDVVAGLVAQIDHAERAADNSEVRKRDAVSLPVPIEVKGAATALVSIAQVTAVKSDGHEYLEITFQNSGATANTMVGQAHVLGAHPHSEAVKAVVAPLTHTNVRVPFAMPHGAKTVSLSVETQDAGGDRASWTGEVGSTSADAPATAPDSSQSAAHVASAVVPHTTSLRWPVLVLVGVALLAAAVWLGAELRRSRRRQIAMIVASAQAAAPLPAGTAIYASDPVLPQQVGALTSKLDTLVDAIDRLVVRLGDAPSPALPIVPAAPVVTAVPMATEAVAPTAPPGPEVEEPQPPTPVRSPAETGAILYAPAAAPVPDESAGESAGDEQYPYDWPTQEQLDQFEARQRATRQDPS